MVTRCDHHRGDTRQRIKRFARVTEALGDGVWDWDLSEGHSAFSDSYYRLSGYEPDAFEPTFESWSDRIHPDDRTRTIATLEGYLTGELPAYHVSYRFRRGDGSYHWILARGKLVERDQDGNPARLMGTHTDLSAFVDVEQVLPAKDANLRSTLDAITDAVITTDQRGLITGINPAGLTLLHCDADGVRNRPLDDIVHLKRDGEDILDPLAIITSEGSRPDDHHLLELDTGAGVRHLSCNGSRVHDASGRPCGTVVVLRDVTDQVAMEEQVRHAQRMDSIGQLAGGVAHDFNNMLAGIMGAAELLALETPANSPQADFVNVIIESAARAGELTEKLLAFSRKAKVLSTPIDIHEVIANALTILRRTIDRRIAINVELGARSSSVIGDPVQIENAVINLCINARDAMPDGGLIEISTTNVILTQEDCAANSFGLTPGQHLQITIRDHGGGMSPDVLEHAFDPFYTTKAVGQGTGLGLAAVYGTILEHRGAIQVSSALGEGTVFHLTFEVAEAAERETPKPPPPRPGNGRILIIDDEEIIRATASHLLRHLGYDVIQAIDGLDGLEAFQRERPDLIILDMVMPRMDGETCFNRIRDLDREVPIIISSGFTRDSSVAHLFERGLSAFVKKPYRMRELADNVAAAIGQRQATQRYARD